MTGPVFFVDGKPVKLGKQIGKGGEGEVFALEGDTGKALKAYTIADLSAREAKIAAMVAARLAETSALIAFPTAIARDAKGRFVGFVMRLVSGHKPLFELYSPGARKQNFPRADYRFLVHTALNIAKAVAKVHQTGCVIGDINHSGILVADNAVAALIDADSFQMEAEGKRHLCRVGVPEYTPPELQGKKLGELVRTPNHDAFGVAIVIFQLLFMGRHPFVGAYANGEMPIERAIGEFRFAYSQQRSVGMTPPPGSCSLADFPLPIRDAFEAAFGREAAAARPTAAQWVNLLDALAQSLRPCAANKLHFFSNAGSSCPWCRMEAQLGIALFVPEVFAATDQLGPADLDHLNVASLWAAIEALQLPRPEQLKPTLPDFTAKPSSEVAAAKADAGKQKMVGWLLVLAAIVAAVGIPPAIIICLPVGIYGLVKALGEPATSAKFQDRYRRAAERWNNELDAWGRRSGLPELLKRKEELKAAKAQFDSLERDQRDRVASYRANRRNIHLHRYLDAFQISRASIKGIGVAKLATLASYGIETAADVKYERIIQVPGFGSTTSRPLMDWRRGLEARFVYNEAENAADRAEIDRIQRETVQKAATIKSTLQAGLVELKQGQASISGLIAARDGTLVTAFKERLQSEADLTALAIARPSVEVRNHPNIAGPRTTVQPVISTASRAGTPSCPRCGSSMRRRTARRGRNAGNRFWGCSRYPTCTGTRS